jgi:hypothetical protein
VRVEVTLGHHLGHHDLPGQGVRFLHAPRQEGRARAKARIKAGDEVELVLGRQPELS